MYHCNSIGSFQEALSPIVVLLSCSAELMTTPDSKSYGVKGGRQRPRADVTHGFISGYVGRLNSAVLSL